MRETLGAVVVFVIAIALLDSSYAWIGLLIFAVLGWNVFTQVAARRQYDVITSLSAEEIRSIVDDAFSGRGWEARRTGNEIRAESTRPNGPTVAARIEPLSETNNVSVWTSNWTTRGIIMNHGQLAWRKKSEIVRAIRAADDTASSQGGEGPPLPGTEARPAPPRVSGSRPRPKPPAIAPPTLDTGLRISSSLDAAACLDRLDSILRKYRDARLAVAGRTLMDDETMPIRYDAGWSWIGSPEVTTPPHTMVCYMDGRGTVVFVAMWESGQGTDLGVFPRGSGEERFRSIDFTDEWRRRDPSAIEKGRYPSGLIAMKPPSIDPDFCSDLLRARDYPLSAPNLVVGWGMICEGLATEMYDVISRRDPDLAAAFADATPGWNNHEPGHVQAQRILDLAAEWAPAVLPDMQYRPALVRTVHLTSEENRLWNNLHM